LSDLVGARPLLSERGSSSVEFVLILPLIVLVLVATMEVAALARARMTVVAAAREGARVAATHPDPAEAAEATREALGSLGASARSTVTRPHVVGRPAVVEVAVPQRLRAPILDGLAVTLTGSATMRVER